MNNRIDQIPGLDSQVLAQLQQIGIKTTRQLWTVTRTQQQQYDLAQRLQVHAQHVKKWAALADLAQVPGVGTEYCGLLLHAGIGSVQQLSTMPIKRVHQSLLRLQVALLKRNDLCPDVAKVRDWINNAKKIVQQR